MGYSNENIDLGRDDRRTLDVSRFMAECKCCNRLSNGHIWNNTQSNNIHASIGGNMTGSIIFEVGEDNTPDTQIGSFDHNIVIGNVALSGETLTIKNWHSSVANNFGGKDFFTHSYNIEGQIGGVEYGFMSSSQTGDTNSLTSDDFLSALMVENYNQANQFQLTGDNGSRIAGTFGFKNLRQLTPTAVPAPPALASMVVGLAYLGWRTRRRHQRTLA